MSVRGRATAYITSMPASVTATMPRPAPVGVGCECELRSFGMASSARRRDQVTMRLAMLADAMAAATMRRMAVIESGSLRSLSTAHARALTARLKRARTAGPLEAQGHRRGFVVFLEREAVCDRKARSRERSLHFPW